MSILFSLGQLVLFVVWLSKDLNSNPVTNITSRTN